jgi:hypothetical protein
MRGQKGEIDEGTWKSEIFVRYFSSKLAHPDDSKLSIGDNPLTL